MIWHYWLTDINRCRKKQENWSKLLLCWDSGKINSSKSNAHQQQEQHTHNHGPKLTRLEDVNSFTYLGSIISVEGGTKDNVQARIGKGRTTFNMLNNIWKAKNSRPNCKSSTQTQRPLYSMAQNPGELPPPYGISCRPSSTGGSDSSWEFTVPTSSLMPTCGNSPNKT